jgi:hypothetical protein
MKHLDVNSQDDLKFEQEDLEYFQKDCYYYVDTQCSYCDWCNIVTITSKYIASTEEIHLCLICYNCNQEEWYILTNPSLVYSTVKQVKYILV